MIAKSSVGAEYQGIAHIACEIKWLRTFMEDFGEVYSTPIRMSCDNQAAIHISQNPIFHESTKHNKVNYRFIREK